MGLFWDLYQQSQLSQHAERSGALEYRVATLEDELRPHAERARRDHPTARGGCLARAAAVVQLAAPPRRTSRRGGLR